jgi:hypothetical protein
MLASAGIDLIRARRRSGRSRVFSRSLPSAGVLVYQIARAAKFPARQPFARRDHPVARLAMVTALADRRIACGYWGRMDEGNRIGDEIKLSWRPLLLGPLGVVLFFAALWLNDGGTALLGIILLDLSFSVAMLWVVLAARVSDNPNSPLIAFVPKLTAFLVLGAAFLAATRWRTDPRISAMELGFAALYILGGYLANRIFNARRKGPQLKAMSGGKRPRCNS